MRALLAAGLLALGAVSAAQAATPAATCARAGTDDALRPLPRALVPAARRAFGYTGMTAAEVERMTVFRCMDARILICSWGANLACGKAETASSLPAATNYCLGNPDVSFIPAYVTGHDTIYQWRCQRGMAVPSHPAALDARGFFQSLWVPAD
jgi:hypothetical protein